MKAFDRAFDELKSDFQRHPFDFGNEDMILPEFYHRLQHAVDDVRLEVEFHTDYGDGSSKVNQAAAIEEKGTVSRIRTEAAFVHDGSGWKPENRDTTFRFDLAIFDNESPIVMQSKRTGPSNYCDSGNQLSVLAEIKHSKNLSGGDFYHESKGVSDIVALSTFPGEVDRRQFIFFDWWPEYQNGERRYDTYFEKLIENLPELDEPVQVDYIPRSGDWESVILD